jgi:hypothetical protein
VTRREFVQRASTAAVLLGVQMRTALAAAAQTISRGDTASKGLDAAEPSAQAAFTACQGSDFVVDGPLGQVRLTLVAVQALDIHAKPGGGRECFSLVFRGDATAGLAQDTYTFHHPALGSLQLFIVPAAVDEAGQRHYVATVNRLANSPPLFDSPIREGKLRPTR